MEGAFKGAHERIIAVAHQTEFMARQKSLKDLKHYLKPAKPSSPDADGAVVLAMARRLKAKQDQAKG